MANVVVAWDLAPCSGTTGDDRLAVFHEADSTVVVIADGAGGTGSGATAAEAVLQRVTHAVGKGTLDPVKVLAEADSWLARAVSGGQTTGVVVVMRGDVVTGASVGDSDAWLVQDDDATRLTFRQERKPLIGTGGVTVVPFGPIQLSGTLVVATDGLFKYTTEKRIRELLRNAALEDAPRRLIDLVRLKSGKLQDDVAVAACRLS